MATTNGFTTPLKFLKSLGLVKTIPSAGNESRETVGTGNLVTDVFWLDNLGVIEDTYIISHGAAYTPLTETTHYTLDLDTSKISVTSAGLVAISADIIYAEYSYNQAGIPNAEIVRTLNYAENSFLSRTEMTFADATASNPAYKQVVDETFEGRFDARWKTFDAAFSPIVKLDTTTSANYVTGSADLVLVSAAGFPSAATIFIGGNKVAYTAKSGNTLTVPTTTPSITASSVVAGEVVEISKESEGSTPSFEVLERDVDYKIDFLNGRIELLGNAYFGEFQNSDRFYPANYIARASYLSAWYEEGSDPSVPDDVEQCVLMIATNRLMKSTVGKAHITGLNSFNPSLIAVDRTDIDEIIEGYKQLNVSTSPFNKSHIS